MAANLTDWKAVGASKSAALLSLIPGKSRIPLPLPSPAALPDVTDHIRQYLSAKEVELTETDSIDIVRKTSSGDWTCTEVTEAFCHRAALAHQMINCLHEIAFESALQRASELDAYFAEHKQPLGPLHGLPVSLKDSIHVEGTDTSLGYVGWLGKPRSVKDSQIVTDLRSLGAIIYVKTSVPQGSLSAETRNNIIGYTPNPLNRQLTVGGSSGGEGGLLALRGSSVGLGTDLGGSTRVPAGWNGCYGLRPSTGRLPYEGIASTIDGIMLPFVVGPMATQVSGLELMMRSLLQTEPWRRDPMVIELPWKEDVFMKMNERVSGKDKMAFGIMVSDGYVNPQPPVERAMRMVADVVKALGHKVIEWKPPSHSAGNDPYFKICFADGGRAYHSALATSGEPSTEAVLGPEPTPEANASQIIEANIAVRDYRKTYLDYWNSTSEITGTGRPVDAFIMPLAPFPPPQPGQARYLGYTTIVNTLDYSACAIPVTRVRKDIDQYLAGYASLNEVDQAIHDDYNPELSHGAPVAVQIVGGRLQEEKVLAFAAGISQQLQK
ncbi:probable general amidase [Phialocephala subalpina]|uniref:Probable general amidase n=1 Tax=Phialocephala subalpina TaxID=576137 RepID=A0A1L7XTA1_9HELO|nr:probable general amidase [Phialocephala subalpina]